MSSSGTSSAPEDRRIFVERKREDPKHSTNHGEAEEKPKGVVYELSLEELVAQRLAEEKARRDAKLARQAEEKLRKDTERKTRQDKRKVDSAVKKSKQDAKHALREASAKFTPQEAPPRTGWRGLFWWLIGKLLYRNFGWQWTMTRSRRERYNSSMQGLRAYRKITKIVAVCNSDGGAGKSTTAVHFSKLQAQATLMTMAAFDVNENSGHTAALLGIDRHNTILLRQFLSGETELKDLESLISSDVDWDDETGVVVIASEEASNQKISPDLMVSGLRRLKRMFHTVWCDCGNGTLWGSNLGAVHLADTLVFPGLKGDDPSLDDIKNTMDVYSKLGYADKVKQGVIVIYGGWFTQWNRKKFAKRFDWPIERVHNIPFSRRMRKGKVASMRRLSVRVKAAIAEATLAVVRATPVLSSFPVPETESISLKSQTAANNQSTGQTYEDQPGTLDEAHETIRPVRQESWQNSLPRNYPDFYDKPDFSPIVSGFTVNSGNQKGTRP